MCGAVMTEVLIGFPLKALMVQSSVFILTKPARSNKEHVLQRHKKDYGAATMAGIRGWIHLKTCLGNLCRDSWEDRIQKPIRSFFIVPFPVKPRMVSREVFIDLRIVGKPGQPRWDPE